MMEKLMEIKLSAFCTVLALITVILTNTLLSARPCLASFLILTI